MSVLFDKNFIRNIEKENNSNILEKVKHCISDVKQAANIHEIKAFKKMNGYKNYYRIKIDYSYRIGIKIENDTIYFVVFRNRKDIYKVFP